MYYAQQSPGIAHKLAQHPAAAGLHDPSPWSRQHHPGLGPPHAQPTSPGYPLFTHANGAMGVSALQHHPHPHSHMQGPIGHHHHQNSLSHSHSHSHAVAHYQSPPNGNGLVAGLVQNGSPVNPAAMGQVMTPHWQNQLMKCEVRPFT